MKASRMALGAALVVSAACASAPASTPASSAPVSSTNSTSSQVVTQAELAAGTQANLYDFVATSRPRWLRPRSSGGRIPGPGGRLQDGSTSVSVYVDNLRMGGVEVLRSYSRESVASLRYYDVAEAQQRFNNRTLGAVIQIITR